MNSPTISPAPIHKTLVVKAGVHRSFQAFTSRMGSWWPRTHSIAASPTVEVIIEPRAGGRWYAVGEDGSTGQTGYVIEWQPPQRLVLAWQLNGDWQFDPELVTEVEVRFIAESERSTRVELEHRNLQRMGDKAAQVRGMVDAPGGWTAVLESYKKCAAA